MRNTPIHISAKPGDIAERVIITGDPDRAKILSELLESPALVNTKRGYLIYTGNFEGVRITVASHGIGGSSVLILVEELYMLGARWIVRLGTVGALKKSLKLGDVIVASGASYVPGSCGLSLYFNRIPPSTSSDPILTYKLYYALKEHGLPVVIGPVFCSDSFYGESKNILIEAAKNGAYGVEMETAALFGLQHIRGFNAGAVLIVSNNPLEEKEEFLDQGRLMEESTKVFETIASVLARL